MYAFIRAYAIRHPQNPGRFLIGVHAATNQKDYLPNGRIVFPQRLLILPKMNPWGFQGETEEVIKKFYMETDTCDLYPYPGAFSLKPLAYADSEVPVFSEMPEEKLSPLHVYDLCIEILEAFDKPISFHNLEYFLDEYGDNRTWLHWVKGDRKIPEGGIFSKHFMFRDAERRILMKPYYVIGGIEDGMYYRAKSVWVHKYEEAYQFRSEQDALNRALIGTKPLDIPFDILKVSPPAHLTLFKAL